MKRQLAPCRLPRIDESLCALGALSNLDGHLSTTGTSVAHLLGALPMKTGTSVAHLGGPVKQGWAPQLHTSFVNENSSCEGAKKRAPAASLSHDVTIT